jgi:hypothetical protein
MRRATAAATIAAVLAIGGTACGSGKSATQKAVENATKGKVKIDDKGGVTVDDNGNRVNLGGSELPQGFPKSDVPVPSDATLVGSFSDTKDGKHDWVLTYTVKGDTASVTDAYRSALTGAGYRIDGASSASAGGSSFQSFTAVGASYDVYVAAGTGTGQGAGFVVTVQTHDTSNDTTTSTG